MEKKISYDPEEDILYFNKGKSVQDSLDIGNMFVEFSGDGEIAGMEILDASETISELTGRDFSSVELSDIIDAEIKIFTRGSFAFITLFFVTEKEGEKIRESVGVNVPTSAVSA